MGFEKLSVMVVEDDDHTMATLRMMLSDLGVGRVIQKQDGEQALSFMTEAKEIVDLIISDWNMPNVTGIELLKTIRETHAKLPFIMVSARADINSIEDALLARVSSYIRKPFSLKDLEDKMKMAMR